MKQALTQFGFALIGIGFLPAAVFGLPRPRSFAGQDCECVGNGKRIKEGGVICLQIGSSQRYLARCERNLNNTSWKKISDGCPVPRKHHRRRCHPWPAAKVALRQG
jgi:hypothetical protein